VAQAIVLAGLRPSFTKARDLANQGGVAVNGQKVGFDHVLNEGDVVKVGRKDFFRVRWAR
jgi:tyrosyl-tRNA synthetase